MTPESLPAVWLLAAAVVISMGYCARLSPDNTTLGPRNIYFGFMLGALAFGAYLRFSVLDFGFPELYHPDEFTKSQILMRMSKQSTWNPGYFLHPSLLLYLTKVTAKLFWWLDIYADRDLLRYVLAGRFVSALSGSLAIPLAFYIGSELPGRRSLLIGAFAAMAIATCPLHLCCSRYFKEDALFTTLLLVVFLFSLRSLSRPRDNLRAGFFAGVCAGAKYTGAISLVIPPAALFLRTFASGFTRSGIRAVVVGSAAAISLAVIGFLLTTPYAAITPVHFVEGILFERNHVLRGHGGISITPWSQLWTYHLSRSLPRGMTYPLLFAGLLGAGQALRRRSAPDLLLLLTIVLFYGIAEFVKAKPMPQPERYALPAAMFLIIAGSWFISELSSFRTAMYFLVFFTMILNTQAIVETKRLRPDTRERMASWIQAHVPPNSKIAIVGLPFYVPRLARYGYHVDYLSPENNRGHHSVEALRASRDEYLLVTSLSYDRFFSQPNGDLGLRQRFLDYDKSFPLTYATGNAEGSYGFHNPTLKLYRLPAATIRQPLLQAQP